MIYYILILTLTPFVNDFKELQMKLLASYHGIYDDNDFNRSRDQIAELYERAALPIEKGGVAEGITQRYYASIIEDYIYN